MAVNTYELLFGMYFAIMVVEGQVSDKLVEAAKLADSGKFSNL